MIAVIEAGGKQFIAEPGKTITVNRLTTPVGQSVQLNDLLGSKTITAEVVEHIRGEKVTSRKFRNKTRYQRVKGHRQPLTVLRFTDNSAQPTASKPTRAKKSASAEAPETSKSEQTTESKA